MTQQQKFPPIKNKQTGETIMCMCGCRRVARHVHHINPRCEGGTDHPNNLLLVCQKCHIRIHSQQGDFSRWGKQGGQKTAATGKSIPNLKQFSGPQGAIRWAQYCQRRADQIMGVQ